jgi:formylglycine-generating enzyme required for sulfatase activity
MANTPTTTPSGAGDEPALTALLVDQQSRWQQGKGVFVEAYLDRQPWLRTDDEAMLELILREVLLRCQAGEAPALAEYQRRFPHLAEQLARQFEVEDFIAKATVLSGTAIHEAPAVPPPLPGQLPATPCIPGYEVLSVLGQGGMGVVYRARQHKLDRIVALKMIHRLSAVFPQDRTALLERLRSEAEALARLQHPDIVQIFELGECDGLPFLALEYVPGGSLAGKLAGTPQPADQAAALVQRLARAMHAAHQCGVLHRDLKPDNILLTADGSPKIGDFGLAKRLDGQTGLTATGAILGTPSYMAPEQAEARDREVGVTADVYALGAVLYELLTGRPPFKAGNPLNTIRQVIEQEPVPPCALEPGVPRDLETICLECLQKEPSRRYSTSGELADDLQRFLEHRPIHARPAGALERAAKWARRRPTAATLLAVSVLAVLGLAALTVVAIGQWQSAVASLTRERQARQSEEQQRSLRARAEVGALLSAEPADVPRLLAALAERPEEVLPQLRQVFDEPDMPRNRLYRMRAALALLPVEPQRVRDVLVRWLEEVSDPAESLVVRDALLPHAHELRAVLWRRFSTPGLTVDQRLRLLAALAAFDPHGPRWQQLRNRELLELILQADVASIATLLPVLRPHCQRLLPLLRREAQTTARPDWHDPVLRSSWTVPSASLRQQIERADGLLAERFALVQTLPLDHFAALAEGLRPSGYRPARFQPYPRGQGTGVAALWVRDGGDWRVLDGVSAERIRRQDAMHRQEGYEPVDVAGWLGPGNPVRECYAALWARVADRPVQSRMYVALTEDRHLPDGYEPAQKAGLRPLTALSLQGADRARRYSGIWGHVPSSYNWVTPNYWIDEVDYRRRLSPDRAQFHVNVRPAPRQTAHEYARTELAWYSATVQRNPGDLAARLQRGLALARLQDDRRALQDLDAYLKEERRHGAPFLERAFVLARLGRAEEARKDLREFRRRVAARDQVVPGEALLAVYLGQEVDWSALEDLARSSRTRHRVLYDVAVVHAQAAHWYRLRHLAAALVPLPGSWVSAVAGTVRWLEHRDRAVALLQQAVAAGLPRYWELRLDLRLAPLHDHAGYQECFHPDREYSAVWHTNWAQESAESHGLAPAAHLARCRQLAGEDYRPVALSVAETTAGRPLVTASVWQRPIVGEREREPQCQRQAAAGLALLKLGQAEAVWPLLKHSSYPETRSRLTLQLGPAGIDAGLVVERLEGEPDVSIRRALILALGEYTAAQMPAELRQRLVPRLLAWYREAPDAGIHGAIDWLLRHGREGPQRRPLDWRQGQELERIDKELARASRERQRPEDGKRGWYVNRQSQTFVVVDGHAPFLMGSRIDESGRFADETLHWRRIGRRYAIATKPVTVAQFQHFLQAHPEVRHRPNEQVSPTPDSPIVGVTWYLAAQYCRWLSEQEGITEDQMVYPSIAEIERCKDGKTALRMPANYLKRTGYRLHTEVEWEFACRAGARTSSYFGSSSGLVGHYAWFAGNSRGRTWPVGQKRPNDLGLFDMHGNVFTWCQERAAPYPVGTLPSPASDEEGPLQITDRTDRVLRGASFALPLLGMRSARRHDGQSPTGRLAGFGVRVARTLP